MKILLDINTLNERMRHPYLSKKIFEATDSLILCGIEISILDKCLEDFCWHFNLEERSIRKTELEREKLKKLLKRKNINIIELSRLNYKSINHQDFDVEINDFFCNLQIAYAQLFKYNGILTHNPHFYSHDKLKIFEIDVFLDNYNYERIYDIEYPLIIGFSIENDIDNKYHTNKKLISNLDDFSNYFQSSYIDPEYFFRVAQEVDINLIYNLENEQCNDFGKTIDLL